MAIKIIEESKDGLIRETWGFRFEEFDLSLRLSWYWLEVRKSKRCKYKIKKRYDCGLGGYLESIKKESVPFGDDIINKAKQILINNLSVKKY